MYSDRVDSVTRATNPSPLSSPLSPLPLPFACRPLLRHLSLRRNHHCHHRRHHLLSLLFLLLPSPFSSPFSLLSASSPRRVRTHQRVKHAPAVRPEFFFLFFSLCILCLVLSISPPFTSPFILSLSFPIRLTTIFLNSSIRRILPYRDILSISPSSPSFRPSHFRVLFFARFARASVSPSHRLTAASRAAVSSFT